MCQIEGEDLVRALKKFKSLAKQDLLASERTADPMFWRTHAQARRNEYNRLINLIESFGVEKACVYAFQAYKEGQKKNDQEKTVEEQGAEQAITLFFQIIGHVPADLRRRISPPGPGENWAMESTYHTPS